MHVNLQKKATALRLRARLSVAIISLCAAGCGHTPELPVAAGMGPQPTLPPPSPTLIPTVKVAKAVGWATGATPVAPSDLVVRVFADRLDHPRWLHVLPNGDVLVAETNAPPRPEDSKGIRAAIMGFFMK